MTGKLYKPKLALCLAGVLVVMVTTIVGAASASAVEPVFVPQGGTFPVTFTSTGGEKILRTHVTILKIEAEVKCKSTHDTGELTGTRSSTDTIAFTGCEEVKPGKNACHSTAPLGGAGEIITKKLTNKPVWLEEAKGIVGIALGGEGAGEVEAEFECGANKLEVTGSVIGEVVSKLNEQLMVGELAFKCKAGEPTKQKWTSYEEPKGTLIKDELLTSLNGNKAKESSCEEEIENDKITFAEPVEIRT